MTATDFYELSKHYGHKTTIGYYGSDVVAIYCETCREVLISYNKPSNLQDNTVRVKVHDLRYTTVKGTITPYEYIRSALVERGLTDVSITYSPSEAMFTVKFGDKDRLKHAEINDFIKVVIK